MLKMEEFFMIRELHQKGWSLTAIAEETGFDRKTIRKYINAEKLPRSSKRTKRASKLDPYKSYLLQRIQEGTTNCVVLLEEIRAQGFDGKSTILKDFVQPHREQPKKQATRRFETPPGQQAQMDWAEVGLYEVDGRLQKIYAFLMVLGYSRMKYIEFTTDMKLETLMKCHMNAFAYFNGIPNQVLYDNMKTVVIRHTPAEIRFNQKFEDFLAYYGVTPKACKPYRPQTKGKVERTVDYMKRNFFQRRHDPTLEALNQDMRKWLDQTANKKKNETTQEPPVQRWQKEQSFLQAWGTKELFPTTHWEMREVSRDCFISYLGNKYSVPFRYAGHQVKIKVTLEKQLEIFDEVECIAQHPILSGETRVHVRFEHYEGMQEAKEKERKPQNPIGLATQDSTVSTPYVEARPLAAYAAFEGGDFE